MSYWSDLHDALDVIGISKGDIVYVGSDIAGVILGAMRELGFKGRDGQNEYLNRLIDELKVHVGEEGTLMFPVYNWDFCKGIPFNYYKTQGSVGALNNFVLNERKDFVRTRHPLYSLMVWGKYARQLHDMDNQESWGQNSPFAFLHHNGGKELDINVNATRSMTFKHYVEQQTKVPYRYQKFFMGEYTDEDGITETRTYSMYVRRLEVSLEPAQTNEFFAAGDACKEVTFHGLPIYAIDLPKAYDLLQDDLLHNGGHNVYTFENYDIDWQSEPDTRYQIGFLKDRDVMQ